jgi:DNA replication protein DnaC
MTTTNQSSSASTQAHVEALCARLKLPTVARLFPDLCVKAVASGADPATVIAELLQAEVEERDARQIQRRLKEANFPRIKTIDDFDFKRNDALPEPLLRRLVSGENLDEAEGVILVGEPGSGKTHLATALGIGACRRRKRVRFVTAANLVNDLVEAKDARALGGMVRRYARYSVLVIDDLGYLPLAAAEAELFFQVLTERSERAAVVVTTNLPFSEFTKVFPDKRLCAAVLDRLTHNAHIIDTGRVSQRAPKTIPSRKE